MEPHIIFEDTDMIIIDKPSGVTVNKADTTKNEITIQDWVENKFKIQTLPAGRQGSKINEKGEYNPEFEFNNRAGIVHRLDKETSGILIIAKNVESFIKLQKQFKERTIKKRYIALAHGKIIPEDGQINVPVGRLSFNRKRFGIVAGGRDSCTLYKTTENLELRTKGNKELLTLVELFPQTGRTHQIRVHLKYIHHPIFSDELYGGRKTAREDRKLLPRLFLHASGISFFHPSTNNLIELKSPLPEDLQNFLQEFPMVPLPAKEDFDV